MNRSSTDGSVPSRRRLDFASPVGSPSSPFELLSPISRFDKTDLDELSPFVHNQRLNGTSPIRPVPIDLSNSIAKQRRRCSEIVVASGHNNSSDIMNPRFPSFSTSHWFVALYEWISVTFSDKQHQAYVFREIIHSLHELGIIPLNISITSEQLLQIQQVIDSLRLRFWQEHSRGVDMPHHTNGEQLGNTLVPFAPGSPRSQLKHSLTFAGPSLAKFPLAAQRPRFLGPRLPRVELSVLFPAGRYKNDFHEQEQLGRGGFGVVVKTVNRFDMSLYAIKKVFVKQDQVKQDQLFRALREARAASSLNHPNVVRYYAAWIEVVSDEDEAHGSDNEEDSDDDYKHTSSHNLRQVPSSPSLSDEFDINHQLDEQFEKKKPFNKKAKPAAKNDLVDDDGDIYFRDDSEPSQSISQPNGKTVFQVKQDSDEDTSEVVIFGSSSGRGRQLSQAPQENRLVPVRRRSKSERRSPSVNSRLDRSLTQPSKVCLYIQMELCHLGTLADWLTRRNNRTTSLSSSPSSPVATPSSPHNSFRHSSDTSGLFDIGSPPRSLTLPSPTDSFVNTSWNASVFLQIVRGLAYVHSRGVIHRDLKPANIFLTGCSYSCPEVKIGDFGLTRFDVFSDSGDHTSLAQDDLQRYSTHGRYSTEVGTRTYASPEQVTRVVYTRQSDMFSLGLILYELYRPFATTMERLECFESLRKGGPEDADVSERYPDTWRLVKRLTDPSPSKRPNCTDLLAELETNEVDRLREVVEQQRREIERLKREIVVDSPSSRFSPYYSSS